MAGQVIRYIAEWLIVAFVAFALIFEILLHKVEHWVFEHHKHVQAVLRNLYRELMILGVISFGFIVYIFASDPDDNKKMTFEVAHVFIFLFSIFHGIIVFICIAISLHMSRRWKIMERMDLVKYLEVKEDYRKITERRKKRSNILWQKIGWWLTNPTHLFKYSKLHEIMTFHDIRYQFIYYRNLTPDFKFSTFLRKIKFATFIELVEIHAVNWVILLALVMLDILRIGYMGKDTNFEPYFLMAHSVFNMLLVTVLARKIRNIFWKLTKNPATYFDTIDPHAFRTELKIAEEEARIQNVISRDEQPLAEKKKGDLRYSERKGVVVEKSPEESKLKHLDTTAINLLETAKKELGTGNDKISLDMAATIPEKELDHRAAPICGYEVTDEDLAKFKHMSTQRRNLRIEALRRLREKKEMNPALGEHAEDLQEAQMSAPSKSYPKWVLKLIPRLGRVGSNAEKLFWFGSHRLYLFGIEFVIFFSNINLSTSIAKISFYAKKTADYNAYMNKKSAINTVAKFLLSEYTVRAPAGAKATTPIKPNEDLVLLLIALGMGVLALFYVLTRIAGIMKKYIFILNNANLLPEDILVETIQHVNLKKMGADESEQAKLLVDYDSDTGSDIDHTGTNYRALRRNITGFLEKEHSEIEVIV